MEYIAHKDGDRIQTVLEHLTERLNWLEHLQMHLENRNGVLLWNAP